MPTIKIKNFLIIKDAEFDIKKINVIIGEQTTGKSVIAKLVYFFNRFFPECFMDSFEKKEFFKEEALSIFSEIFPYYSWEHQEFSITYHSDTYNVTLKNEKKEGVYIFHVECSKELEELYESYDSYKNFRDKNKKETLDKLEREIPDLFLRRDIKEMTYLNMGKYNFFLYQKDFFSYFKKNSIFIPTARSFFILLGNNIFSLLKNDIKLDIFMKEFGSLWESTKNNYIRGVPIGSFVEETFEDVITDNLQTTLFNPSKIIENITQKILRGKYLRDNNEDYIEHHDGSKIRLKDASSGQQDALPMLMILSKLLDLEEDKEKSTMVFIEEPEAHLFPKSQKAMISLIATIANARDCPFVLTTHSPYILSAINNLIVGADAFEKIKDNPDKIAELEEFIPQSETVRFEEVSVYTLADGTLTSIMDTENRLIGTDIIDGVSIEFADAFDKACAFLYGDA